MSQPGLGGLISSLRSALSLDSPSGRLQLTVSTSPPPNPPLAPAAGPAAAAGAEHHQPPAAAGAAPDAAQERLLNRSSSSVSSSAVQPSSATAARSPPAPHAADGEVQVAGSGALAPAPGGSADLGGLAAEAEAHRLANLSSSVDLRALAIALERGLPYALLLLILFMWLHIVGLSVFAYLTWLLVRANRVLRAEVARKADLRRRPLLGMAALLAAHVPLALLALRSRGIAGNLVLLGSVRPTQVWEVAFTVVVGDCLLRFLAVLAKVGVLLSMPADSPARFRRRGHVLTAVEHVCAAYRLLPPTPLWYSFLGAAPVAGLLRTGLSGAYLLVKAQQTVERAALAGLAVQQVALRGSYGSAPSAEEVQEAGNQCPICQDAYRDPVKLSCSHIFCQDCLGEWLERERTCPMCRAAVGPAASNKRFQAFADGRTPAFPTIF